MASLFLTLPRTATTTICSSSSLLVAAFTQHLASHPPSAPLLKLLRLYQVHSLQLSPTDRVSLSSLGKSPENSGTSFYARIRLLARNSIAQAAHLTKAPTPHPECSTFHQDQKGLMPLLALLVVSISDAFLKTNALSPSHLSENSHHEYFKALSYTSDHPKTLKNFYYRNRVLATNCISNS